MAKEILPGGRDGILWVKRKVSRWLKEGCKLLVKRLVCEVCNG